MKPSVWVMKEDLTDSAIVSTPAYRDLEDAQERTVGDLIPLFTHEIDLSKLDELAGEFLQASVEHGGRVSSAYTECAHLLANAVRDLRKG